MKKLLLTLALGLWTLDLPAQINYVGTFTGPLTGNADTATTASFATLLYPEPWETFLSSGNFYWRPGGATGDFTHDIRFATNGPLVAAAGFSDVAPPGGNHPTNTFTGPVTATNSPGANQFAGTFIGSLTGNATSATTATGATNLAREVTPEQFGGKADLVALNNCFITNGSKLLFCPTANFTSNDVGKTYLLYNRVLYAGATPNNIAYTNGTIIGVSNATELSLSLNAPDTESGTAMFRYGTENTAAFQAVANLVTLSSNNPNQSVTVDVFLSGWYLLAGPCIYRNSQESSVIHFPSLSVVNTNQHPMIHFRGPVHAMGGDTAQNGPSSWTGAGIFCGTWPSNTCVLPGGSGCCVFGGCNNTNGATYLTYFFSTLNVEFENITFREPYYELLSMLNFRWGGGLWVNGCAFDVDFPPGALILWGSAGTQPYNTGNTYHSVAIYLPDDGNNAEDNVNDCWIWNYWLGIYAKENAKISSSFLGNCENAIMVGYTGPDGVCLTADTLAFCQTNLWGDATVTGAGGAVVYVSGLVIAQNNASQTTFIFDPGNILHVYGWVDDALNGSLPHFYNGSSTPAYTGTLSVTGSTLYVTNGLLLRTSTP
jgi:hypothetical protein